MGGVLLEVGLQVGAASPRNVPGVQHLDHHVRAIQDLHAAHVCVGMTGRVSLVCILGLMFGGIGMRNYDGQAGCKTKQD